MSILKRHPFEKIVLECFDNLIQNEGFRIKKDRSDDWIIYLENGKCGLKITRDDFFIDHFIDFYDPNVGDGKSFHYSEVVRRMYPELVFIHKENKSIKEKFDYSKKILIGNSKFIENHLKMIIQGDFRGLLE